MGYGDVACDDRAPNTRGPRWPLAPSAPSVLGEGKQSLGMFFEATYFTQQMANRKSAHVLKLKVTTEKEMTGIFS